MCVCVCACVCARARARVFARARERVSVCVFVCARACLCVCASARSYTHAHLQMFSIQNGITPQQSKAYPELPQDAGMGSLLMSPWSHRAVSEWKKRPAGQSMLWATPLEQLKKAW